MLSLCKKKEVNVHILVIDNMANQRDIIYYTDFHAKKIPMAFNKFSSLGKKKLVAWLQTSSCTKQVLRM